MGWLVWLFAGPGVLGLVCGGILLGWSMLGNRPELWNVGLPIGVAGQVLLLVALVLQLERLWSYHRRSAEKLDKVDHQLHDLRSTAALLGTTHSTPAAAFYSHLASDASPEVLLVDLKGQLDLLATRLNRAG